mmetsp:Transcript_39557/g.93495  ORF Transcript_39557/g.93495 Transcript_39557/m.93495 type:complete len:203 (-) Transcript_39557:218-826(-)
MSTKRAEPKVGVVTVTVVEAKRLSAALPTDATVTLEPPLPPKVTVEVPEAKMYFTLKVTLVERDMEAHCSPPVRPSTTIDVSRISGVGGVTYVKKEASWTVTAPRLVSKYVTSTVLAPAEEVGVVAYTKSSVSDARFGSRKNTSTEVAVQATPSTVTIGAAPVSTTRFGSNTRILSVMGESVRPEAGTTVPRYAPRYRNSTA